MDMGIRRRITSIHFGIMRLAIVLITGLTIAITLLTITIIRHTTITVIEEPIMDPGITEADQEAILVVAITEDMVEVEVVITDTDKRKEPTYYS